ncbi:MAG: sigma-70 family RNA polymerase sigma factor [Oscillospiraceae bacterium]|jgi:RNA polymerase sporulation-specific sigma factor|nr:sigma-70 family RNA polymerase sigma factor [Oscillospiraceae bacterium]
MIENKTERDSLISDNIGLVHACANRFRGKGVDYDDLFQAGCIGIIKAADGFKKELGFAFSTYAVPVILGEIKKIFRDQGSVKIGRALKEKARNATMEQERLRTQLDREPTISELANRLGIDIAETAQLLIAAMPTVSLTAQDDESSKQIEIPTDSVEDEVSEKIALSQVMDKLPKEDKQLIELRYFEGLTQTVTAQKLNMSQVQVSRKERKILKELRQWLTGET